MAVAADDTHFHPAGKHEGENLGGQRQPAACSEWVAETSVPRSQ